MKKLLLLYFIIFGVIQLNAEISTQTQLREAIEQNNAKLIQQLIKQGANVNAKYESGTTPLHIAASKGNLKIVKLLVENGADVNALHAGANPLYFAAMGNHTKVMKYLIEKGADVNTTFDRMSIFFYPCKNCYKDAIEILLKNKAEVNVNSGGLTTTELVVLADKKTCPLNKKEQILKMMIKYGADINMNQTDMTINALDVVIMSNMVDEEKMLVKLGAKSNYAIIAHSTNDNKEMIEFLLENGFDINAQNPEGETALDYAKTEEMKQFLISHGAKSGKELK